jgi:hypothetical protein
MTLAEILTSDVSHLRGWRVYEVTPARDQLKSNSLLGRATFDAVAAIETWLEIYNANDFKIRLLTRHVAPSFPPAVPEVPNMNDNWTKLNDKNSLAKLKSMSIIQDTTHTYVCRKDRD